MSIRIGSKYHLDEISNADWKQAEGITEDGKKGTNSMLAERNYDIKCNTGTEPLLVINGVWVWYCKVHHQPLAHCEMEKFKANALLFAEAVRKNDKTKPYNYGGYGYKKDSENNDGEQPAPWTRWLTPKEIALNFISDLKK